MPITNPLREEEHPQEESSSDELTNIRHNEFLSFEGPDGAHRQHLHKSHISTPGQDGTYQETTISNTVIDAAGNPLNPADPASVKMSHTGLWINSEEEGALCTWRFHPAGRSRNIRVGQDGVQTPNGAICDYCRDVRTTIYLVAGVLIIGIIAGLFRGAWVG